MPIDRRRFFQLGTALSVGTILAGRTRGVQAATGGTSTGINRQANDVADQLRSALEKKGLRQVPALPIISQHDDFNGGLRHDSDLELVGAGEFVFQPCARVADIDDQGRMDVLPVFHECAVRQPEGGDQTTNAAMMMEVLTGEFGLDPARLAFVSVPQSEAMRSVFADLGIDFDRKVFVRDRDQAFAAQDGSGFFFPDPSEPDHFVTMGIYYRLGENGEDSIGTYPAPAQWTEIGELVIDGNSSEVLSLGVERLSLAVAGQFPSWDDSLADLIETVESESAELGTPPGIEAFRQ